MTSVADPRSESRNVIHCAWKTFLRNSINNMLTTLLSDELRANFANNHFRSRIARPIIFSSNPNQRDDQAELCQLKKFCLSSATRLCFSTIYRWNSHALNVASRSTRLSTGSRLRVGNVPFAGRSSIRQSFDVELMRLQIVLMKCFRTFRRAFGALR
jgi:hypothetical protein